MITYLSESAPPAFFSNGRSLSTAGKTSSYTYSAGSGNITFKGTRTDIWRTSTNETALIQWTLAQSHEIRETMFSTGLRSVGLSYMSSTGDTLLSNGQRTRITTTAGSTTNTTNTSMGIVVNGGSTTATSGSSTYAGTSWTTASTTLTTNLPATRTTTSTARVQSAATVLSGGNVVATYAPRNVTKTITTSGTTTSSTYTAITTISSTYARDYSAPLFNTIVATGGSAQYAVVSYESSASPGAFSEFVSPLTEATTFYASDVRTSRSVDLITYESSIDLGSTAPLSTATWTYTTSTTTSQSVAIPTARQVRFSESGPSPSTATSESVSTTRTSNTTQTYRTTPSTYAVSTTYSSTTTTSTTHTMLLAETLSPDARRVVEGSVVRPRMSRVATATAWTTTSTSTTLASGYPFVSSAGISSFMSSGNNAGSTVFAEGGSTEWDVNLRGITAVGGAQAEVFIAAAPIGFSPIAVAGEPASIYRDIAAARPALHSDASIAIPSSVLALRSGVTAIFSVTGTFTVNRNGSSAKAQFLSTSPTSAILRVDATTTTSVESTTSTTRTHGDISISLSQAQALSEAIGNARVVIPTSAYPIGGRGHVDGPNGVCQFRNCIVNFTSGSETGRSTIEGLSTVNFGTDLVAALTSPIYGPAAALNTTASLVTTSGYQNSQAGTNISPGVSYTNL